MTAEQRLVERIEARAATVAISLGFRGVPGAVGAAKVGFTVVGVGWNATRRVDGVGAVRLEVG
jgi:UDP-N-acetyl-D-mannosaminuronate dehydrogenase